MLESNTTDSVTISISTLVDPCRSGAHVIYKRKQYLQFSLNYRLDIFTFPVVRMPSPHVMAPGRAFC